MLDKQPATPTIAANPVILPEREIVNSFITKPEQHQSTAPLLLQPIKDSATEEKEVRFVMSCDNVM